MCVYVGSYVKPISTELLFTWPLDVADYTWSIFLQIAFPFCHRKHRARRVHNIFTDTQTSTNEKSLMAPNLSPAIHSIHIHSSLHWTHPTPSSPPINNPQSTPSSQPTLISPLSPLSSLSLSLVYIQPSPSTSQQHTLIPPHPILNPYSPLFEYQPFISNVSFSNPPFNSHSPLYTSLSSVLIRPSLHSTQRTFFLSIPHSTFTHSSLSMPH